MSAQSAIQSVCDTLRRSMEGIEKMMNDKLAEIGILQGRLDELNSGPNPDPIKIQQLEEDIRRLNDQLAMDQGQLALLNEEFLLHCS